MSTRPESYDANVALLEAYSTAIGLQEPKTRKAYERPAKADERSREAQNKIRESSLLGKERGVGRTIYDAVFEEYINIC